MFVTMLGGCCAPAPPAAEVGDSAVTPCSDEPIVKQCQERNPEEPQKEEPNAQPEGGDAAPTPVEKQAETPECGNSSPRSTEPIPKASPKASPKTSPRKMSAPIQEAPKTESAATEGANPETTDMSTLKYELEVKIVKAKNLRDADTVLGQGDSDPYVKVGIVGKKDEVFKTKTVSDQANPEWNEVCKVPEFAHTDTLQLTVLDQDLGKKDDMLGHVQLPMSSILPTGFQGELRLKDASATAISREAFITVHVQILSSKAPEQKAATENIKSKAKAKSKGKAKAKSEDDKKKTSELKAAPAAATPPGGSGEVPSEGAAGVDEAQKQRTEELFAAIGQGQVKKVKQLIKDGADMLAKNADGITPLLLAVKNQNEDVVGRLVIDAGKNKAKVFAAKTPDTKETALHLAVASGSKGIVVTLVRAGMDVKAKNGAGKTSIQLAKSDAPLRDWLNQDDPGSVNPPWIK